MGTIRRVRTPNCVNSVKKYQFYSFLSFVNRSMVAAQYPFSMVDHLRPPPAHIGHLPHKPTGVPLCHPSLSPPPGHYQPPVFSHDFTHSISWPHSAMYCMASSFRTSPQPAHPSSNSIPPTEQRRSHQINASSRVSSTQSQTEEEQKQASRKAEDQSHIKKPLNAFMLYMREMRASVMAECTLKESAAINQLLGKKWHSLSREEQSRYYELAKHERQLHAQKYPGWTARDNYALHARRKKKRKDPSKEADGNNPKKCRARFGLDQQSSWCKPCRRKKKCVRWQEGGESGGSIGSPPSPESPSQGNSCTDSGNGDENDDILAEDNVQSPCIDNDQSEGNPAVT